jgi:WD40-like Beta Propeller Repeat
VIAAFVGAAALAVCTPSSTVVPAVAARAGRRPRSRRRRRTSYAVVLAVAAAGVAAFPAADSAASARSSGGKLVLAGTALNTEDFGRNGLYVMNADGSGLRQITHDQDPGRAYWSRDGNLIAFEDDGLAQQIVLVRGDGTGRRVLGRASSYGSLDTSDPWSPDGKRIAWGGCGGLCVYDLASSRRTRIALGAGVDGGFSWSPDGLRIAVADVFRGLVVVERSGQVLAVLAKAGKSPPFPEDPAFSPDGRRVAFLVGRKLEVVPAGGGRARVLDKEAGGAPSWSPDGRRLLYTDVRYQTGYGGNVRVVNVATGKSIRVSDSGIAHWSPDGTTIAYGRLPAPDVTGQDVWLARPDGSRKRQLTDEFPSGIGYTSLDWASGSLPAGKQASPPAMVDLKATSDRPLADLSDLSRAGTPASVAYENDDLCDPVAETFSSRLNVWTPSSGSTDTTTTGCQDLPVEDYAVTPTLAVWDLEQNPINGSQTMTAERLGTTEAPTLASWTSDEEAPDIGWRSDIGPLISSGTTAVFETATSDGSVQLWEIVDGAVPHAVQIPLPPDATDLVDADGGQVAVCTGKSGYAVLGLDGRLRARVPATGTARLGGNLLGVASGTLLRVYDTDGGSLRYQLPLAHTTGQPRLLTVGDGYAVYASGIALHLLRLDTGSDRTADLPGQAGPVEAVLTTEGLFLSYFEAYDPVPGRLLFVAAADMP